MGCMSVGMCVHLHSKGGTVRVLQACSADQVRALHRGSLWGAWQAGSECAEKWRRTWPQEGRQDPAWKAFYLRYPDPKSKKDGKCLRSLKVGVDHAMCHRGKNNGKEQVWETIRLPDIIANPPNCCSAMMSSLHGIFLCFSALVLVDFSKFRIYRELLHAFDLHNNL